jgi:hypothetical protein
MFLDKKTLAERTLSNTLSHATFFLPYVPPSSHVNADYHPNEASTSPTENSATVDQVCIPVYHWSLFHHSPAFVTFTSHKNQLIVNRHLKLQLVNRHLKLQLVNLRYDT